MIALLLSSLVSFYLFIVFGFITARALKLPCGLFDKFFLGLLAVNTIVSIGSIFLPVNLYFLISLIIAGLFFGFLCRIELSRAIKLIFLSNRNIILYSAPFVLIAFIISLNYPITYDTGMYHIQMIKWIEEYAAVPGLANLHSRFGFNSNIFTVFALTSFSELFNQEIFAINFTVMAVLIIYFIHRLFKIYTEIGFSALWLFYLIVFLVILRLPNLSTPSPDFLATTVPFFIFLRMVELYKKADSSLGDYAVIFLISIYVLTIKLAAVPIALLFIFVIIKHRGEISNYLWLIPLSIIIVLPWLIRNVILTGWLVYPFPGLDLFSFDWQVPLERVVGDKNAVTGWGRMPGPEFMMAADMAFMEWFPQWWKELGFTNQILFFLSIASPLIAFVIQIIKRTWFKTNINAIIFSSFAGVIFWLFMAPDWRFGEVFIITAAFSPLLWLNLYWKPVVSPHFGVGVLLLGLWSILALGKANTIKTVGTELFQAGVITPLHIQIPEDITFNAIRIGATLIYYPENVLEDRCFDHQLPCTPYPDPTLEMRGETLSSGFRPGKLDPYQDFNDDILD